MSDKDRVIARLQGKDIKDLVREYYKLEDIISEILSEMPASGDECKCDRTNDGFQAIKFVHEGSGFDEVIETCIKCGGYVER